MTDVKECREGVIVRSRPLNWLWGVGCCGLAALFSGYFLGLGIAVELTAAVLALAFLEVVTWRDGLRPRIVWNKRQLKVVYPFRERHLRWSQVSAIEGYENLIRITTDQGDQLVWAFDRLRWLARLSARHEAQAESNHERLTTAFAQLRDQPAASAKLPSIEEPLPEARRPLFRFAILVLGAMVLSSLIY